MIKIKGLFNDNESEVDYLGYANYISVFDYIINEETGLIEPPIVFGLHGDWGIGKSTFMNLLKKQLDINNNNITIRMNPWEYKENDDIISLFFINLYKELKGKKLLGKLEEAFDRLFELIYPLKLKVGKNLFSAEYDISKIKDIEKANLLEKYVNENHLRKENIKQLLESPVLLKKRIIVFIDDLDRCSVEKIINILETIKLFLNYKHCIFFLGCDINYLNSAVANYYDKFIKINNSILNKENKTDEKEAIYKFTKEYLEKIIQVPFHIPHIDKESMEVYIDTLLSGKYINVYKYEDMISLLKQKSSEFKTKVPHELIKELFSKRIINPRRIKRVLNLIYLNYLFLITKNSDVSRNDINLLVLLAIINDEEHYFYEESLSSKEVCLETFRDNYTMFGKMQDFDDETTTITSIKKQSDVINQLFETFFRYVNLGSVNELNDYLSNISNILTVSNTTNILTGHTDKWGRIGEIESISRTKRKMKTFLNNIDNDKALDFCRWFLNDIFINLYDKGKINVGIYGNCNLLLFKTNGNVNDSIDFNESFLMKIFYNSSSKNISILFETGRYKTCLPRKYIKDTQIIINDSNYVEIQKKLCEEFGDED